MWSFALDIQATFSYIGLIINELSRLLKGESIIAFIDKANKVVLVSDGVGFLTAPFQEY